MTGFYPAGVGALAGLGEIAFHPGMLLPLDGLLPAVYARGRRFVGDALAATGRVR